jgi:hypothetical protein
LKRRPEGRSNSTFEIRSSGRIGRYWMTQNTVRSTPWKSIAAGARTTCPRGSATIATRSHHGDIRIQERTGDGRVCGQYGVKYLFFGKSGAILLGYSDTTQDVYLYVEAPCGEAWLPGRQYRRRHREQAGGKPPERQGIAASSVVVPGVVEKKSLGRVLSHVPAKARGRGWA